MRPFFYTVALVAVSMLTAFGVIRFLINIEKVPQEVTVELSIGGDVKVLKTNADNTIHVIVNDDLVLTDIQVIHP